jgi:hypothetical protein
VHRAARLACVLCLGVAGRGSAQAMPEFRGIGVWAFQVAPARSEAAPALHLRADLGRVAPRVRLAPSLTFWATRLRPAEVRRLRERVCEEEGTPCAEREEGEVRLSDLSLDVDARYLLRPDARLRPYVGAGAGMHLVNGGGGIIDNTFVEGILDAITPGANALAGVELHLGRGLRLHGEARAVLAGGANWIGAGLGASVTFPARRAEAPTEARP